MKRFNSIVLAAFAAVIGVAYALPSGTALAQGSASLSIVPKKNYTIEPGKTVNDKLLIRNLDAKEPLYLDLRVVDFSFKDDTGTPKLFLAADEPTKTWSMKPFIKLPEKVTIPPMGSKSVDLTVSIPAGHGAGSYYSAIVYSSSSPDGGKVNLNASGVTLAFTSIPGKVNEDLKLEKFGAYQVAKDGKSSGYVKLTMKEPKQIAYTLKNNGNVTEAPVGSIKLNSMWGKEIDINDVNPNQSLALIGQSRTYTACIKLKEQSVDLNGSSTKAKTCDDAGLWPGYYSVDLNLFYGQNGNSTKEITGATYFWYLPVWFLILLLVLALAIAYIVWRIVRNIRQRKSGGVKLKKPSKR